MTFCTGEADPGKHLGDAARVLVTCISSSNEVHAEHTPLPWPPSTPPTSTNCHASQWVAPSWNQRTSAKSDRELALEKIQQAELGDIIIHATKPHTTLHATDCVDIATRHVARKSRECHTLDRTTILWWPTCGPKTTVRKIRDVKRGTKKRVSHPDT